MCRKKETFVSMLIGLPSVTIVLMVFCACTSVFGSDWDINYEGDTVPGSPGWNKTSSGSGTASIVTEGADTFLYSVSGMTDYQYYTASSWSGSRSNGITIETRQRVTPSVNYNCSGIIVTLAGDSTGYAYVQIYGNGDNSSVSRYVKLTGASSVNVSLDTTQFHVYRMTILDTTATLYIDGNIATSVTTSSGSAACTYFGDGSTGSAGHVDVDYYRAAYKILLPKVITDWSIFYDGDVVPGSPDWTKYSTGDGTASIVTEGADTFLYSVSGMAAYQYYIASSWSGSRSTGITIETRQRVTPNVNYDCSGIIVTLAGDSTGYAYVRIYGNGGNSSVSRYVTLTGASSVNVSLDTTQFHVYRMTILDTTATLYIDGSNAASVTTASGNGGCTYFGDGSTGSAGYVDIDYYRAAYKKLSPLAFTKSASNPVIQPGGESLATLNVLHSTTWYDGTYKCWYTGADSSNVRRIYYATSSDAVSWTKQGVVVDDSSYGSHAQQPTVVKVGSTWYMWYTASPDSSTPYRIFLRTSSNGTSWGSRQLVVGPSHAYDNSDCRDAAVVYNSADANWPLTMWYTGRDTSGNARCVVAHSPAGSGFGVSWYKSGVIDDAGHRLDEPAVVMADDGKYQMFFTRDGEIGYSKSADPYSFLNNVQYPVLSRGASGQWDSAYIQAAAPVWINYAGGLFYVYYSGCNPNNYDLCSIGLATAADGL